MARKRVRNFAEWQATVPPVMKNDPLWKFELYPKTLFLHYLAWEDCEPLLKDTRGRAVARQLIRSVGSISANIEEGFGRGYGRDYAYRLKIALGEAREARGWYWRGNALLSKDVLKHRLQLLSQIIALLTVNIRRQQEKNAT